MLGLDDRLFSGLRKLMMTGQGIKPRYRAQRRSWSLWLGLFATLVCLIWAAWALDWPAVRAQLAHAQLGWLLAASGALFLRIASRTARWRVFFAPPRPPFAPTLTALLVGQTVNYVAPVWAGDLGRAYFLGNRTGHSKGVALGTVVLDKLCDLLFFLLFLTVLPFWIDTPEWLQPAMRTLSLLAALGIGALVLGLTRRNWVLKLVAWVCQPLPDDRRDQVLGLVSSLLDGLIMLRHPSTLLLATGWSLVLWGWDAAAHYAVFRALSLDLPFVAAVFLSTALRAGFALSAMPGQIGVYEGIVIGGLGLFGVEAEVALGVGLLRHAVDLIPPLVVVLALLALGRLPRSPGAPNETDTG